MNKSRVITPEEKRRDYKLRSRYGISLIAYESLLDYQHGKCAICGRDAKSFKKKLSIDHNHSTGHIRGILCSYCNTYILRHFRDNKAIAKGLVKYLQSALREDKEWK